jgi:hypothetical protein
VKRGFQGRKAALASTSRRAKRPSTCFYIDANPKFGEGNGLLTLIPVTFANALFGVGFHALKKKLRARRVQPKDDHSGRP